MSKGSRKLASQPAESPLAGVRVLDFSRIIAGPLCTLYLSDLGADVIKVERPVTGDEARSYGPAWWEGIGATFLALNRGKRSICLDMASDGDKTRARELASECDVVVENFRPGVMSKWGLSYDQIHTTNPGLVYCSLTGFGSEGPLANQGANNLIAQAFGGAMYLADPDVPKKAVGPAITDLFAGVNAALAVVAALHARTVTNKGQLVQTSLLEAQAGLMSYFITSYLGTGRNPTLGEASPFTVPNGTFRAADRWLVVAVNSPAMWERLCHALEQPEWIENPAYRTNEDRLEHKDEIVRDVSRILQGRSREDWLAVFDDWKVTAGPVNTVSEFVNHPQTVAMEVVQPIPNPAIEAFRGVRVPFTMSDADLGSSLPPPGLGEHDSESWINERGRST